jgi:hypothetical protein
VLPRRLADRLEHGVDALRQLGAALERLVRAELDRLSASSCIAAGHPHAQARSTREHDRRAGHAAARALDQHRVARLHAGLDEQHPVGGQPRGRQARRLLERERRGLGHEVAARYRDLLRQRALVLLRQQRAPGIERLVAAPPVARDHRVHDHLVAVGVDAGRVAAEDHRQRLLGQPDAAQRPQVVVVERRRAHVDRRPAVRRLGVGPLADLEG